MSDEEAFYFAVNVCVAKAEGLDLPEDHISASSPVVQCSISLSRTDSVSFKHRTKPGSGPNPIWNDTLQRPCTREEYDQLLLADLAFGSHIQIRVVNKSGVGKKEEILGRTLPLRLFNPVSGFTLPFERPDETS